MSGDNGKNLCFDRPLDNLSPVAIQLGQKLGLAFVCQMCKRWSEGVDRTDFEIEESVRCTGNNCTGPLAGGSFPEYDGPLGSNLSKFCFKCGKPAESVLEHLGPDRRMIGVCAEDLDFVRRMIMDGRKSEPLQKVGP